MKLTLTSFNKTCEACPAQWEGRTTKDEPIYIRYRWGYLSVRMGEAGDEDAVSSKEILGKQLEDGLAGSLNENALINILLKNGIKLEKVGKPIKG